MKTSICTSNGFQCTKIMALASSPTSIWVLVQCHVIKNYVHIFKLTKETYEIFYKKKL